MYVKYIMKNCSKDDFYYELYSLPKIFVIKNIYLYIFLKYLSWIKKSNK